MNEKSKDQNFDQDEEIHPLQKLFDRPFVLLLAGMLVMLVFYTGWGILEIMSMDKAPLP